MKHSKRFNEATKLIEKSKEYSVDEAVEKIKSTSKAKFDETIDIAIRLRVNRVMPIRPFWNGFSAARHWKDSPRTGSLEAGAETGEARQAGAHHVGFDDYLKKLQEGWADIDVIVSTPDSMADVGS